METVSIVVPIYNSKVWIRPLFESILAQTYQGPVEICVWDDSSSDDGLAEVEHFRQRIQERNWQLKTGHNADQVRKHRLNFLVQKSLHYLFSNFNQIHYNL